MSRTAAVTARCTLSSLSALERQICLTSRNSAVKAMIVAFNWAANRIAAAESTLMEEVEDMTVDGE
jgi:hypothetical protein